jgi:transposase-like protein
MSDNTISVCPNCDNPTIDCLPGGMNKNVQHKYRCHNCGEKFDSPDEREPKKTGSGDKRKGLSKKLAETDVDIE